MAAGQTLGGLTGYRTRGLDGAYCYNVTFAAEVRWWVGFRPMGWVRSNRRPWAWVALLALTLQFGLEFGHCHATPAPTAALTGAAPHTDTGDSGDADYCATCAMLALLTGAQTATAPVVVLAIASNWAEITFAPEAARTLSQRAPFRSRAPPVS
jgi:hypothetical protein